MSATQRHLYRYAMYAVDPAWRRLPDEERARQRDEVHELIATWHGCTIHPYSTVGLRSEVDLCLWLVAEAPEALQAFQAALNGTGLGRWLRATGSYLAMTKPSRYLRGHTHDGQEHETPAGPIGLPYLFVYPMDKRRSWYALPFEERRRMMGQHFAIGHRYPGVKIHTGYSFGIDDQEFVVAFEGSSLGEFLDLVEELRGSEASAYTARDVPIYTGIRMSIEEILAQLDGSAARVPAR